ncbi:MAG: glutaredoxin family protein [Oceanospirillaceae bacterium]|nr:glutaredoxin family protein [Oceanospirillaceae bacterium]MBT4442570.1 glutaredoxin family protein [Oceanospirillaceae bacterium]MBT6076900.1 glutaredoxin family protein [Oceanospirillaceae bacterium]MBT7331352.1 glutaredoxin family protein [Oceanospirillaceae bacterium]
MGTSGCHLCDDAEALLVQCVNFDTSDIVVVDIAESDVLLARYATRIPVLYCIDSRQELNWPFDRKALTQFLLGSN